MAKIEAYLHFNGSCEEAFNYYKSLIGGEFGGIARYKDMPPSPDSNFSEEQGEKIMNMSLSLGNGLVLYGSDANPQMGGVPFGKNVSLHLSVDSKEDADRIFEGLSEDGETFMPITQQFWGDYFGMCEDKFGMNWMVNFPASH